MHGDTVLGYGGLSETMPGYNPSSFNNNRISPRSIPNHSPRTNLRPSPGPSPRGSGCNNTFGSHGEYEPEQLEPPGCSDYVSASRPGLTVRVETRPLSGPLTPPPQLTVISPSPPISPSHSRNTSSIFRRRNMHGSSSSILDVNIDKTSSSGGGGGGGEHLAAVPGSIPDDSPWLSPTESYPDHQSSEEARLETLLPKPPSRRRILSLHSPSSQQPTSAATPPPRNSQSDIQSIATAMGLDARDHEGAASQQQQAVRRSPPLDSAQQTAPAAAAAPGGAPTSSWTLPASSSRTSPSGQPRNQLQPGRGGGRHSPPSLQAGDGRVEDTSRVQGCLQAGPATPAAEVKVAASPYHSASVPSFLSRSAFVGDSNSSTDVTRVHSLTQLMHDGRSPVLGSAASGSDGKSSADLSRVHSLSQLLHDGRGGSVPWDEVGAATGASGARLCPHAAGAHSFLARSAHVGEERSGPDMERVDSLSELMNDGRGAGWQAAGDAADGGGAAAAPPEMRAHATTAPSSFSRAAHVDRAAPAAEFGVLHRISHLMHDGREPPPVVEHHARDAGAPLAAVSTSALQLASTQNSFSRMGYRERRRSRSSQGNAQPAENGISDSGPPPRRSEAFKEDFKGPEYSPFARSALSHEARNAEHPLASSTPCIIVTPAVPGALAGPGSQRAIGAGEAAGAVHKWFKLGEEGALKARSSMTSHSLTLAVAPVNITSSPALGVRSSPDPNGVPLSPVSPSGRRQAWGFP